MNTEQLTLEDLFATLESREDATSEEHAKRIEAAQAREAKRKKELDEYKETQLALEPTPFIVGKEDISFRTSSWCFDTCGNTEVSFTAVARDDEFIYFWNIGKVEWHQNENQGITHSNPFFKMPISKDNSNWWQMSDFMWIPEEEWKATAELIINKGVLSEIKYFDYLFDYVES